MSRKSIGILGGTFDPIHNGHLRLALELKNFFVLEKVLLVPAYIPPHRGQPIANPQQRLHMLQLAVESCNDLEICTLEFDRKDISYTVDTLNILKSIHSDKDLVLILGEDAFNGFRQWHCWQEIISLVKIIVAHRPGFDFKLNDKYLLDANLHIANSVIDFQQHSTQTIFHWKFSKLNISATEVRSLCSSRSNPQFLIPDMVWRYILENKIYGNMV